MGNKYYKEGLQFYQEEDYEAASIAFAKSVNYDTNNADAYFNLANSYRILERKEEAIAVYEKVIELFPTNSRANRSKAYLKELQKE